MDNFALKRYSMDKNDYFRVHSDFILASLHGPAQNPGFRIHQGIE